MRKKQLLSLALIAALTTTMFAGCGSSGDKDSAKKKAEKEGKNESGKLLGGKALCIFL